MSHFYSFGSLRNVLDQCGSRTINECFAKSGPEKDVDRRFEIARSIAIGLVRIHGKGIVHRDIKPENILVGTDLRQLSVILISLKRLRDMAESTHTAGTLLYFSPEILNYHLKKGTSESIGLPIDIWALGCLCYELIEGKQPPWFETLRTARNLQKMKQDVSKELTEALTLMENPGAFPEPLPKTFEHFAWRLLRPNPNDRPTAKEMLAILS